jgi:hypothetical protein
MGQPKRRVEGVFSLRRPARSPGCRKIFDETRRACAIDRGPSVVEPGDLLVEYSIPAATGSASATRRIAIEAPLRSYWCDLHGQSEETIGTNSARDLIEFARDRAFLDGMSHQGNDFQITTPFWNELNQLTRAYNADGSFVIFPGYEWSATRGSAATETRCSCGSSEKSTVRRTLVRLSGICPADANSATTVRR